MPGQDFLPILFDHVHIAHDGQQLMILGIVYLKLEEFVVIRGKSTFCRSKPIFIQSEGALIEIDRGRFPLAKILEEVNASPMSLRTWKHEYDSIEICSLDRLGRLGCKEHAGRQARDWGFQHAPGRHRIQLSQWNGGDGHGKQWCDTDATLAFAPIAETNVRKSGIYGVAARSKPFAVRDAYVLGSA